MKTITIRSEGGINATFTILNEDNTTHTYESIDQGSLEPDDTSPDLTEEQHEFLTTLWFEQMPGYEDFDEDDEDSDYASFDASGALLKSWRA